MLFYHLNLQRLQFVMKLKSIHICVIPQFGQIIHAIHDLDADVISIETSRSHGDLIKDFEDINYDLGIGLGCI